MLLILGGTAEARALAQDFDMRGVQVTSSLAGAVARPRLPEGAVRIGGFGGPEGLADWLGQNEVRSVIDATHPFAQRISRSAELACTMRDLPLLRLERPGWSERPGDHWNWVDSTRDAAGLVPALGERAFLTTGRQDLDAFAQIEDVWFLIRCVDPPQGPLPQRHQLLLDRGPYRYERELALIDQHRIDVLVTKDSGGDHTVAKLDAARERQMPVIVVRRPPRGNCETVACVPDALAWALKHHSG